jgi:hypothetical protein
VLLQNEVEFENSPIMEKFESNATNKKDSGLLESANIYVRFCGDKNKNYYTN